MNRVNHSQLFNHGGGSRRRGQEGLFHPFSRELCSQEEMCVSAGAGQLGGHKASHPNIDSSEALAAPQRFPGKFGEPGLSLPLEALTEGKVEYF